MIEIKLIVNWRAFFLSAKEDTRIRGRIWEMEPLIETHEYKTSGELASFERPRVHYAATGDTMRAQMQTWLYYKRENM